jgi:hypothetical protein
MQIHSRQRNSKRQDLTNLMLNNIRTGSHKRLQLGIPDTPRNGQHTLHSPPTPINNSTSQIIDSLRLIIPARFVIVTQWNEGSIPPNDDSSGVSGIAAYYFGATYYRTGAGSAIEPNG